MRLRAATRGRRGGERLRYTVYKQLVKEPTNERDGRQIASDVSLKFIAPTLFGLLAHKDPAVRRCWAWWR